MYCPNCGNSLTEGLKYCKGCGTRLVRNDDKDGTPGKMLNQILETLLWFAIAGLGILVGLVAVLLGRGVPNDVVAILSTFYLFVILVVSFMLVRQIPKLIDARVKAWSNENAAPQPQLASRTTAQLEDYREPARSVTEHTTRTLDKVPFEKN